MCSVVFTSQFGGWEGGSLRLLTSPHHWSADTASPASLMVKWELGGKGEYPCCILDTTIKDRTWLGPEKGKARWGQEKEEGPSHPLLEFRLLLQGHGVSLRNHGNDVHNFAEMPHELQIEGSQATPRNGGVSEPPCPPPPHHGRHARATLGTEGRSREPG